jgi:DNA invertase Pin-like site-specific DNA recombinase
VTSKNTRAAIYARISHDPDKANGHQPDDQPKAPAKGGDGLGVARQEQDCRERAEHLRLTVAAAHVFVDNDTSAYSGKRRRGFEAMLDAMKNHQFDVLLCWHTDRLYRSMKDLERLIDIAELARVSIRTVQGGELDLSTSAGRMVARILGSVARQESEHMSERRIRANRQKAEAGKWQSANRTFGYTMKGEPLEPEAAAVRKAALDVLGGKSIQGVAREWEAAGLVGTRGRPFNAPSVRRLLVNPRYAALKTHQGKVIAAGNWKPLIDPDTHKGLVAYLSDPGRVKCTAWERKYIGSGLYRCGVCDDGTTMKAAMPGSTATRPNNRKTRAYVCRKRAHVLRQGEPLDDYVTGWIIEVLSAPKAHLLLDNQGVDLDDLNVRREALVRRKDGVRRAHRAGSLDEAEYLSDLAELAAQIAECDTALADATRTSPAASLVAAGEQIWERWQQMSPTERAQAIDEVATVTILPATRKGAGFNPADVDIEPKR